MGNKSVQIKVRRLRLKMKFLFPLLLLLVVSLTACNFFQAEERRVTDQDFEMMEDIPSPDGQHRILIYHYNTGALDFSRAWWAITPSEYRNLNLVDYEIPDGYKTAGWSGDGELLVEKWEPYYYRQKLGELKTGDVFKGVKVRLLEKSEIEARELQNKNVQFVNSNTTANQKKNANVK